MSGARQILLYGAGQLGMMALTRYFFQWVLKYAGSTDAAGGALFATGVVGLLFLGFRVFDGATDPLAGAASDHWVRSGRARQKLLWFSFLLPPIGLAMVFSPTFEMGEVLRWLLLTGGMFVFFLGYTFYAIPYWSLLDDYSQGDRRLRTRLSNTLGVGLLLATGLGFVLSPLLVGGQGYFRGSLIWGVPCALLMLLPIAAAPKDLAGRDRGAPPASGVLRKGPGWKVAVADRHFFSLIILFAAGHMSFTVMTAAAPYIAVDLLGGKNDDVAALLGPFLLTAVVTFVFVPRIAARFGIERAVLACTLGLGAIYGGTGLLGTALIGTPLLTAMCVFAAAGPVSAVLLGLEGEAIASAASKHSQSVTSLYFGLFNLIVKILNGVALFLTGLLAATVTPENVGPVRGMGFMAGGLLVLGVVVYWLLSPKRGKAKPSVAEGG